MQQLLFLYKCMITRVLIFYTLQFFCLICRITFVVIAAINAFLKDLTALAICKSPLPHSALAVLHFH